MWGHQRGTTIVDLLLFPVEINNFPGRGTAEKASPTRHLSDRQLLSDGRHTESLEREITPMLLCRHL